MTRKTRNRTYSRQAGKYVPEDKMDSLPRTKPDKMVMAHLEVSSCLEVSIAACRTSFYHHGNEKQHKAAIDNETLEVKRGQFFPHQLVKTSELD
jgi:hypothetical protein